MALIGVKFCVAAAPVSRVDSFVVLGGPAVSWVVSEVISMSSGIQNKLF